MAQVFCLSTRLLLNLCWIRSLPSFINLLILSPLLTLQKCEIVRYLSFALTMSLFSGIWLIRLRSRFMKIGS